ncbi:MAG: hypothetical protein M1835_006220 [Candelina submexicana]|nr:MAG: hypothetical protein M1835_006220 [Candelina submexicana]
MPVQHTLFGRTVPYSGRLPPRRILFVLGVVSFFAVGAIVISIESSISISSVSSVSKLSGKAHSAAQHIHKPKLPKLTVPNIHNPFRASAHKPPVQANSTSGEAQWFTDWKWLNPFSSSITLDENRSVLPPLKNRPPIYTFYDSTSKKDEVTRAAENDLLFIWRRAWWAQGFRPVVLGRAEAMNNPLYQKLQSLQLEQPLESEFVRLLAWGNMGTGILANWLVLPMGYHEDHLLSYFRRGEYPKITRYEGLDSGILSGEKTAINAALQRAMDGPELKQAKSIIDAFPKDIFDIDPDHESIAFYDYATLTSRYKSIGEKFVASRSEGLGLLAQLINAHLHTTWQNSFSKGIAVLKPVPVHMTALVEPGLQIAAFLAQCPESPLPTSCPPNRPKCKPCVAAHPLLISTPTIFRNDSSLYTIGTVPHPFTFASLSSQRDNLDTPYIRRQTKRDPWISAATKELLGTGISGAPRVVKFKEAVASDYGSTHSLWLTAEKESPKDLEWHFGFAIPRNKTDKGQSKTPVPGLERLPPPPKPDGPAPTEAELAKERELLEKARMVIKSKVRPQQVMKEVVEAWNLADTEAWRFARAFAARRRVERMKWEEDERSFAGAAGSGHGDGWGRWFDKGKR